MDRRLISGWYLPGMAAAIALGLAAIAGVPSATLAQPCCFANDRYEGICLVNPVEGETCSSVLSYLNNPISTGKSYCSGSAVRGGWVRVDCKTGKPVVEQNPEPSGRF